MESSGPLSPRHCAAVQRQVRRGEQILQKGLEICKQDLWDDVPASSSHRGTGWPGEGRRSPRSRVGSLGDEACALQLRQGRTAVGRALSQGDWCPNEKGGRGRGDEHHVTTQVTGEDGPVTTEAEMAVMQWQAKEGRGPLLPPAARRVGAGLTQNPQGAGPADALVSDFPLQS